jgi:hypothetical protein
MSRVSSFVFGTIVAVLKPFSDYGPQLISNQLLLLPGERRQSELADNAV